jgi:hypothetical protein
LDNVELCIELGKIRHIDGHQCNSGEAAIGMIVPSGKRDDPLTTGLTADGLAYQSVEVGRFAMALKIIPVAIVEPNEIDLFGCEEPASVFEAVRSLPGPSRLIESVNQA